MSAEALAAELQRNGDPALTLFKTPLSGLPGDDRCTIEQCDLVYDLFQVRDVEGNRLDELLRSLVSTSPLTIVTPFQAADMPVAVETCQKAMRSLAILSDEQLSEPRECRKLMRHADQCFVSRTAFDGLLNPWYRQQELRINEISGTMIVFGDHRVTMYHDAREMFETTLPAGAFDRPGAKERFLAAWIKAGLKRADLCMALAAAVAAVSNGEVAVADLAVVAEQLFVGDSAAVDASGRFFRWAYTVSAAAAGYFAGWTVSHL
jgi:hypothetical protein